MLSRYTERCVFRPLYVLLAVEQVTVNRPKALNALNAELIADLGKAFEALKPAAESSDIRCVILTGAGLSSESSVSANSSSYISMSAAVLG
eukprot:SAG31_NODE_111_length_24443_cov_231.743685_16_plen_91_part_00